MNILLIHQYYLEKNEGGGSRWNEITKVWSDKGHTITVLAGMSHYNTGKKSPRYKGRYFFNEEFLPGIQVIRSHVSEAYNVNFAGRMWGYFSFMFSSLWAGLFITKGKFDVIIATSPPLFVGITGYLLSLVKRIPFIFEIRDLWPESAVDTGVITNKWIISLAYRFEKFIYKKARLINVLTPAFKDILVIKKKVPIEKIICIPNAADFSLSDRVLESFDVTKFRNELELDGKLVLTYVGAHGVANHLIQVVDAAEKLRQQPVMFLMIGDGMQKKMLENEVKHRALNNIRFIDPMSKGNIYKYIIASDVGLSILKRADTFKTVYSNKTFDYMSCKKPVLMAIDGVSRELIEDAQAGMFVEPENPEDLAGKVLHYLADRKLTVEHGENGYKYAKLYFDRQVLANKYLKELIDL